MSIAEDMLRDMAPQEVQRDWERDGVSTAIYCLNGACRWCDVTRNFMPRAYCPNCGGALYHITTAELLDD